MYKDYRKNKTELLKALNENTISLNNLDPKSVPCLDITNWDGKGEMPTTIKSADMDNVIKKIAQKEGEGKLKATEVFETAYDKVFGKGMNSYRPYDDISDSDYRDLMLNMYKNNLFEDFESKKDDAKSSAESNNLDSEIEDIKASEDSYDEADR